MSQVPLERHDMIIEYMGETVSSVVADLREREYEKQVGSCYLFRLDNQVCFFMLLLSSLPQPEPEYMFMIRERIWTVYLNWSSFSLSFSLCMFEGHSGRHQERRYGEIHKP
jgi:hypothetical protein